MTDCRESVAVCFFISYLRYIWFWVYFVDSRRLLGVLVDVVNVVVVVVALVFFVSVG